MTPNLFDLTGKTAIVTGGAGHLGTCMTRVLSAAGAKVYIAARNQENAAATAAEVRAMTGGEIFAKSLDVHSLASVESCFNEIIAEAGAIDVLINNASDIRMGKIPEVSEADWELSIDGTINGVFRCTKAALPAMLGQKSGSIINISSIYGVVAPYIKVYGDSGMDNPPAYGAGKAAILQFTRYCACQYAREGVRVNSVTFGPFPTPKVQQKAPDFVERLEELIPLGRIGQPNEVEGAILFLASNASSYVTGANIPVDGGWAAW